MQRPSLSDCALAASNMSVKSGPRHRAFKKTSDNRHVLFVVSYISEAGHMRFVRDKLVMKIGK